jgi:hypothetical protein
VKRSAAAAPGYGGPTDRCSRADSRPPGCPRLDAAAGAIGDCAGVAGGIGEDGEGEGRPAAGAGERRPAGMLRLRRSRPLDVQEHADVIGVRRWNGGVAPTHDVPGRARAGGREHQAAARVATRSSSALTLA